MPSDPGNRQDTLSVRAPVDTASLLCEYVFMRTTIDIPDRLGRQIKVLAVREGVPLKAVITRALERELRSPVAAATPGVVPELPVVKSRHPGALRLSPEEIGALLVREEAEAYAADVRR